jgi:hypothetical protein
VLWCEYGCGCGNVVDGQVGQTEPAGRAFSMKEDRVQEGNRWVRSRDRAPRWMEAHEAGDAGIGVSMSSLRTKAKAAVC